MIIVEYSFIDISVRTINMVFKSFDFIKIIYIVIRLNDNHLWNIFLRLNNP